MIETCTASMKGAAINVYVARVIPCDVKSHANIDTKALDRERERWMLRKNKQTNVFQFPPCKKKKNQRWVLPPCDTPESLGQCSIVNVVRYCLHRRASVTTA